MFLDEEKLIEDILIKYEELNSLMNNINSTELEAQIDNMDYIVDGIYRITRNYSFVDANNCKVRSNLYGDRVSLYFSGLQKQDNLRGHPLSTSTLFELRKSNTVINYKIVAETILENINKLTFYKYNQILYEISYCKKELEQLEDKISKEKYNNIIKNYNDGKIKFNNTEPTLILLKELEKYK